MENLGQEVTSSQSILLMWTWVHTTDKQKYIPLKPIPKEDALQEIIENLCFSLRKMNRQSIYGLQFSYGIGK